MLSKNNKYNTVTSYVISTIVHVMVAVVSLVHFLGRSLGFRIIKTALQDGKLRWYVVMVSYYKKCQNELQFTGFMRILWDS